MSERCEACNWIGWCDHPAINGPCPMCWRGPMLSVLLILGTLGAVLLLTVAVGAAFAFGWRWVMGG